MDLVASLQTTMSGLSLAMLGEKAGIMEVMMDSLVLRCSFSDLESHFIMWCIIVDIV